MLTIPYSAAPDALGATTGRVGGISPRGVQTFSVDEQERIYVWDQARLRIVVLEKGKAARAISAPYIEQSATEMLVDGGRIYLRATERAGGINVAYEIDAASGRLLQAAPSGDVLYPRQRDRDSFGDTWTTDHVGPVFRYLRKDPLGRAAAYAVEPLSLKGVDVYMRRDGALYELASDFGGQGYAYVYALMPAAGTPPAAPAPKPPPAAPVAFGRTVPDRITARLTGAGEVDLDEASIGAFWWLASNAASSTVPVEPLDAQFTAFWGEKRMYINAQHTLLGDLENSYRSGTRVWGQLASYAASAPSRLAGLIAGSGASIRIAELPGTERALTASDIAAVSAALGSAFSVSEGELPGDLERPFPTYEVVSGDTVIQLRHDHYASVGRWGALAHDGRLYDTVRRILPVPKLGIDDPRSLFLATAVTIAEDGYPDRTQDISRWKASIVRDLTATGPYVGGFEGTNPLTLTFTLADRVEVVRVTQNAYAYRGVTYPRQGMIGIVQYRGVP